MNPLLAAFRQIYQPQVRCFQASPAHSNKATCETHEVYGVNSFPSMVYHIAYEVPGGKKPFYSHPTRSAALRWYTSERPLGHQLMGGGLSEWSSCSPKTVRVPQTGTLAHNWHLCSCSSHSLCALTSALPDPLSLMNQGGWNPEWKTE